MGVKECFIGINQVVLLFSTSTLQKGPIPINYLQNIYLYMNENKRRLKSIQSELLDMYEGLFGSKYIMGLQASQKEEFNSIIEAFRSLIYQIKMTQNQRQKKEKTKNYKASNQEIAKNFAIREQIKKAENILQEAIKRNDIQIKSKQKNLNSNVIQIRRKIIINCQEMLLSVKQAQQSGIYKGKKVNQNLTQLKQKFMTNNEQKDEINLQQEEALTKFRQKDQQIQNNLDQFINNANQLNKALLYTNQKIDLTGQLINKNLIKVDKVQNKVNKGQKDLQEVLRHYRPPNKLCLDILLVLMLLALVGVIINMFKTSTE